MPPIVITDPRAIQALHRRSAQTGLSVEELILNAFEESVSQADSENADGMPEYVDPLLKMALFMEQLPLIESVPAQTEDDHRGIDSSFGEYLHHETRAGFDTDTD